MNPVEAAALPREVRAASPERRRDYSAALGFERQLVAELTKALGATAGAATGPAGSARDLLPGGMADALMGAGGLGLALDLWKAQSR